MNTIIHGLTPFWVHSGFNVHAGARVEPEAKAQLADLAQYILRNPFSVEKMTMESPTDSVIYCSRMSVKINRNFEVFSPTDFLAAITQHIPDKGGSDGALLWLVQQQDARRPPTEFCDRRHLQALAAQYNPAATAPPAL